ncbi:hypothetical protein [Fusobacterium necrophorum]|uniref:hypothetical protein n=1 Tax=Fusobacterium necrophorum TaxID=859 RepID=UPI00370F2DED
MQKILKVGTEENYVEYKERLSFIERHNYKEKIKPKSLKMNRKEEDFTLNVEENKFENSPEFMLLQAQITKIVEEGEVIFDYEDGKRKISAQTFNKIFENADNLDEVLSNVLKANKLSVKEEEEEEEKND